MTNGDFAFFDFDPKSPYKPWIKYSRYVGDQYDLPRRQRAFYAVKQVLPSKRPSIRHSKKLS